MSVAIDIADLTTRLSEFVKLAESGEEVLVCRFDMPVARLVPLGYRAEPQRLAEIKGWLEDDDPFQRQIAERRTASNGMKRPDPFRES